VASSVPRRIRMASCLPEQPVSARLEANTLGIAPRAETPAVSANPSERRVGDEAPVFPSVSGLEDRFRLHTSARLARAQKPAAASGSEGEGSARRSDARLPDPLPGQAAVRCTHDRPHFDVAGARADGEPDVPRSEGRVNKVLCSELPRAAAVVAIQQTGRARRRQARATGRARLDGSPGVTRAANDSDRPDRSTAPSRRPAETAVGCDGDRSFAEIRAAGAGAPVGQRRNSVPRVPEGDRSRNWHMPCRRPGGATCCCHEQQQQGNADKDAHQPEYAHERVRSGSRDRPGRSARRPAFLARHYVSPIRFLVDIAALLGLVVGGAVAGFARPPFLLKRRWIPIALAAALLGALGWLILVLSEQDEYYGDGTTVWEHSRRTGAWVFVIVAAAAAAASIVGLVWAASSSGGRLRSAVLPLTAVACLLLLLAAFYARIGH
jgi:hypothetical protein